VVDHIKRRRDGGSDALDNLRSLCDQHDRQVKERPSGQRANAGKLFVRGCDANGRPLDPNHPWNRDQVIK
jgi:5-methylcytosine-specific restriction endonuclease McrA